MVRVLFVGDLTYDVLRRERAAELMAACPQFGLEPLDATIHMMARVHDERPSSDQSASRLGETVHRMERWIGAVPRLIVGFDPLHAAMAMHFHPGVPVVLHVDGMGSGLPSLSLSSAQRLPGLHEVLTGTLRGAAHLLVSNPRNASTLAKQWGVDSQRIQQSALDIGSAGPLYLDATRAGLAQTPTRFHWWMDLWHVRAGGVAHGRTA